VLSTLWRSGPITKTCSISEWPRNYIVNKLDGRYTYLTLTLPFTTSQAEAWASQTVRGHPPVSLPSLSTPPLSHTHPYSYVHSPTLCTITRCQVLNADDSWTSKTSTCRLLLSLTSYPSPPLLPLKLQTSFGHIGTGPRNTTAPSAITWTPIFGRPGTRRLGTAFVCISL
jgi:hypothetical protein